MFFSIFATAVLVIFMDRMLKKTNNLVIKSDLLHYKSDLYANIGIIIALVIIKAT
jgi:divalent metal cation (Fe/Co/Zn/Cd) transporter